MTTEAGRTVSNTFRQESYKQSTKACFILLMTLSHADWVEDVRVASDPFELLPSAGVRGIVSNGLEYLFLPFSLNLPTQDDTGISKCEISIDNVDRRIIESVREATSKVSVAMQVILSSDPDNIEISYSDFKLERVSYDAFIVSGEISVEYFDLEPFPKSRYVPSDFPGIF